VSGWKIFAAVLGANLVTMGLAYAVIDTALSVQRTEAALADANPVYTPLDHK
jgi:hypothetical protein